MNWHEMAYVAAMAAAALCVAVVFGYCSILLRSLRTLRTAPLEAQAWTYGDVFRVAAFYLGLMLLGAMCASVISPKDMPAHAAHIVVLITTTFANVVVCFYILLLGEIERGKRAADVGLKTGDLFANIKKGVLWYVYCCPAVWGSGMLVQTLGERFGYELPPQPLVGLLASETSVVLLLATSALATIAAPITEEIIFRGFFFSAIRENLGPKLAIVLSAGVFAMVHPTLFAILPIFLLGLLLAWSFERTKTLAVPMAMHMTHNAVTILWLLIGRLTGVIGP